MNDVAGPGDAVLARLRGVLNGLRGTEAALDTVTACFGHATYARFDILASSDGEILFVRKKSGAYDMYEGDHVRQVFARKVQRHRDRQLGGGSPQVPLRYGIYRVAGGAGGTMVRLVVYLATACS